MPQGILIKGVIDTIYNALLYYSHGHFVPGGINLLAEKLNKYPNLKFKVDNAIIPLDNEDVLHIAISRGLNTSNTNHIIDFAVVDKSLIKEESQKYFDSLKEHVNKEYYVISERSLEE